MRVFFRLLRRSLCLLLPIAVGRLLASRFSMVAALLLAAAIASGLSTLGVALLRNVQVGRITWRNYAAGWLLPWGYVLARGRLQGIAMVSASIWLLLAAAGAVAAPTTGTPAAVGTAVTAGTDATTSVWLLLAAWLVDGSCFLYLLSVVSKNFLFRSRSGGSLAKLLLLLAGMMLASLVLHLRGATGWAVVVAGGPPLAIAVLYGLFVLMMLTFGRNARWN